MLNQWDAEKEVNMFPRAAATLKHHHHGTCVCVCGCSYWGCKTEPVNSVHVHLNARVETRKDDPLLFKGLPSDSSRSSSASCSRTSWGRADTSTPRSAIMARKQGEERRRTGYRQQKCPCPPHNETQMVLNSRPSSIISAMPREKSQPMWSHMTSSGWGEPVLWSRGGFAPSGVARENQCSVFNSNTSMVKVA